MAAKQGGSCIYCTTCGRRRRLVGARATSWFRRHLTRSPECAL